MTDPLKTDPLNKLPIDPEWVRKADALTEQAARELGCMVVLVAIQEEGKIGITVDGVPKSGRFAELAKDMPHFLAMCSVAASLQEGLDMLRSADKGAQH